MSSQLLGSVYGKIIDEVCDASLVDFEEGGVEVDTLRLLKDRWQKKLTSLEVGSFPWDPQPQASSTNLNTTTPPTPQATPRLSTNPLPKRETVKNEHGRPSPAPQSDSTPRVKGEPGQYPSNGVHSYPTSQTPQLPPGAMKNTVAQQRAAQALQQQYGARATAQINQLQQSGNQHAHPQPKLPAPQYTDTEDRKPNVAHFSPPMPRGRPPVQAGQQDGPGDSLDDWKAEVARRRAAAEEVPGGSDRLLQDLIRSRQQQIEGGGLMMPIDERYIPSPATRHRIDALLTANKTQPLSGSSSDPASKTSLPQAQGDAAADDEDEKPEVLDEDEINSDLDDPEDNGADLDDDNAEQVMLCIYDKVNRVKNKWKCTLKDGILRVGNKEYVFHKAQGEFEW